MSHGAPPEKYFTLFGFVIVRKADFLAATAFLLAAVSTTYQLGGYLWGPRLTLYPPARVIIFFDHYPPDNRTVTRLIGQITVTNSGQQGRSATIREAKVSLTAGKVHSDQYWIAFARPERAPDNSLNVVLIDEAYPLLIPGSDTVSKETGFAPRSDCAKNPVCNPAIDFIDDNVFLAELNQHLGETINLAFTASTFQNGEVGPASCSVLITRDLIRSLLLVDWYATECQSDQK